MNALQSYSSDNESDEEPVIKRMNKIADSGTNYDDVGMDISEESGDDAADADGIPKNERGTNGTNNARSNSYVKNKAIASSAESDEKKPHLSESTKDQDIKSSDVECSTGRSRSKDRNNRSRSHEKNKSKSKERTIRSRSQERNDRSGSKERSNRSRSRERGNKDVERGAKDRKDSRDHRESRRSSDARDSRDYRRRGSRRSRSRSRERRRSRSRSRSRDRDRRKRRTRSRSRSRSRDRKRPHEIRREAQQKLAAFKASNPNFDHNEMLKRGMEAQFAEVQKNTGVTLPTYYNPAIMNPLKIAEQERKKKLLWGNKNKPVEATVAAEPVGGSGSEKLWVNTKFSNDSDGKMAEKFKRLMGVRAAGSTSTYTPETHPEGSKDSSEILEKQETLFNSMEKQYEVARLATHTQRGFGLGFSSQSYLPK